MRQLKLLVSVLLYLTVSDSIQNINNREETFELGRQRLASTFATPLQYDTA